MLVVVAIWGWGLIGLVVALLLLAVAALWRRMQSIAREEIASGNSQRWWFRFYKTTKIDEESPDQTYITALLEDIKDKPI
ncbi:MAG: hypothetical protein CL522_02040 [Actinobacteria bacterium]|nr:hypothetical protein [Actinomycetota bacterium]